MKKKILSPEALAALAAGTLLNAASADVGAAASGEPQTPENLPTEPKADATDGEAGEGAETFSAEDIAKFESTIEALGVENTDLKAQVEALTAQVSTLEAAALSANAKVQASAEEAQELKTIVAERVGAMRTALSLSAVDMTKWTAAAILQEFNATFEAWDKALPEGSQVPAPGPTAPAKIILTSHDAAAAASLGFK